MKTLDYLHLDASAVSNVVASLKQLLADYQVFYTNLRGFHWNIKGHGFFVLHGKFEDMYNNAAEKVDELAERILMLGGEPENKFSEYLKVARVKEISGVSCGDEALKNILDTYGHLIGEERKLLSLASEAGDEAERLSERTGEVGLDVSSLLNLRLQEIKIVDSLRLKKAGRDSGFFVL